MWQQDIFETEWLYNEFFVVVIIIVFINFYYFTFWLYRQKETAPYTTGSIELNPVNIDSGSPVLQALHEPVQNVIEVTKGGKIELIPPSDIALIYLKDGYCYIKKFDKESFLTTYALDDLFELLNAEEFFRANRQTIINRRACLAYGSIENGKIELEASAFSSEKIIISQKRAKAFRQWIGKR
jgi:DNA-binding LytR/AlgR family response regulator